jgi:hypothetical protein
MYQVQGDTSMWTPCHVVRWDGDSRTFEVVFDDQPADTSVDSSPKGGGGDGAATSGGGIPLAGGLKRKMVKRLNLRFKVSEFGDCIACTEFVLWVPSCPAHT